MLSVPHIYVWSVFPLQEYTVNEVLALLIAWTTMHLIYSQEVLYMTEEAQGGCLNKTGIFGLPQQLQVFPMRSCAETPTRGWAAEETIRSPPRFLILIPLQSSEKSLFFSTDMRFERFDLALLWCNMCSSVLFLNVAWCVAKTFSPWHNIKG